MEEPQVIQVGNIVDDSNIGFKNPQRGRVYSPNGVSPALNCQGGGGRETKIIEPTIAAMRGRNPQNPSERGKSNGTYQQRLEMNVHGTSNTLTGVQKDNLVVEPNNTPSFRIRKLTCREGFRLMGVDDEDIDKIQATGLSNSAQYKLAGNSIVVDVLYHLFRKMFVETENENQQLTFF